MAHGNLLAKCLLTGSPPPGQKERTEKEIHATLRQLARTDLWFLLVHILGRRDAAHPWLFDRCREVEADPNDRLDLWAREHYKSSIITFGLSIQDILRTHGDDAEGQEATIGIFSHTRPAAKSQMRPIKLEFENNVLLKSLFPDILYEVPKKEAPKWSEDDGIMVRRKGNPREATVEAWGLVDSSPTGKHFNTLVFDDVVDEKTSRSMEMMAKVEESLKLAYNLGTQHGVRRMIGTRYRFNDPYRQVIEDETFIPRLHPGREGGRVDGKPVFWSEELHERKRREQGSRVYSCQILQNPLADSVNAFKLENLRIYSRPPLRRNLNIYVLVDPANSRKKDSDHTGVVVFGLGVDRNYYVLDAYKDRLGLSGRTDLLFALVHHWSPLGVGYEQYGLQADIEHIEEKQDDLGYHFNITPLGGPLNQIDRILGMQAISEQNRIWVPASLRKTLYDGTEVDIMQQWIRDEYEPFPLGRHPDLFDAMSRILDDDLGAMFPLAQAAGQTSYQGTSGTRRH